MIAATTDDLRVEPTAQPDNGWRRTILLGGAVAVALALSIVSAPTVLLLLVALPILTLVPGYLAATLVLGVRAAEVGVIEAAVSADDSETADETAGSVDSTLRVVLPPLMGLLTLLATVLLVAVVGAPIDTSSICLALAGVTLALLLAVRWLELRTARSRTEAGLDSPATNSAARPSSDWRSLAGRWVAILAAAVVLLAAVAGARALQPSTVERYSQISFAGSATTQEGPLTAAPGADVTIPWSLASYGYSLTDTDPTVQLVVGDSSASNLVVNASIPGQQDNGTGSTSEQAGSATFAAPTTPGLYRVELTVTSSDDNPVELTDYLQVG